MSIPRESSYEYQVGGSLRVNAPSYIERQADRELYTALNANEFCYVFNARQMGKSSLRVRVKHQLQRAGFSCASIDITNLGSEIVTPEQWYKGIAAELWRGFDLLEKVNFKHWWQEQIELSPVQQLSRFIEDVVLVAVPEEKVFIFIDEIDSVLSLDFPLDDFFALIRYCFNQRVDNPKYDRLTFALFGVATPSDLIRDRDRTPFNIGRAIELQGFQLEEIQPLARGLEIVVADPQKVMAEILHWTGGQPFLTQKLCRLMLQSKSSPNSPSVEQIVRQQIIDNWEAQDEPEHLKTIRNRLFKNEQRTGGLLAIYQQILQQETVVADETIERADLLLSGLVVKSAGKLKVRNPIYQTVFNLAWVERQLSNLRPYAETFKEWLKSDLHDTSRLLRGQALKDAQAWAWGKSLSNLDYQYLTASEERDRQEVQQALEAERTQEVEARLAEQTKRLQQEQKNTRSQRLFLGVLSVALLISVGLAVATYWQYRRATLSEIEAIATSSDSLFALNKRLEALVEAIAAQRRLNRLGRADPELEERVKTLLLQSLYGGDEYHRLLGEFTVAWSRDGNLIATSKNGTIDLWKPDGTLVKSLTGHETAVWGIAFSPDSQLLASVSEDTTAKIWKTDGTLVATLKGNKSALREVAFRPDGKLLAISGDDGTIKLWKPDGTLVKTIAEHDDRILGLAFSPDNQLLVAGYDKTIHIWKFDGDSLLPQQTLAGHEDVVSGLAFSPNGQILASSSYDNTVKLWKRDRAGYFASQPYKTITEHMAPVAKVVFSPNGQSLASVSWDTTVKLWNLDGALLKTFKSHTQRVWSAAFSPDGQNLATAGGGEGKVRLWHLHNPASVSFNDHDAVVLQAAFSPDGGLVASGSDDRTVKLWNPDGSLITTLKGHNAGALGVAFSPNSRLLASASWDGTVKLWQIDRQAQRYFLLHTLKGNCGANWKVSFSPNGDRLASTCQNGAVKLWRQDGRLLQTLVGHSGDTRGVAFSPDDRLIASANLDKTVKLWRSDGTLLRTLDKFAHGVSAVAFSPDSQLLAVGGFDDQLSLWTIDGNSVKTFIGHQAEVRSVAFSPDGKLLASASADHTIKIWQLDGTLLTTLKGHGNAVWSVSFSPDGRWLISASEDGTAKVWNLDLALRSDRLLTAGCDWARDYLQHGLDVSDRDRHLCD